LIAKAIGRRVIRIPRRMKKKVGELVQKSVRA
jgi:hypothetical protein